MKKKLTKTKKMETIELDLNDGALAFCINEGLFAVTVKNGVILPEFTATQKFAEEIVKLFPEVKKGKNNYGKKEKR